VRVAPHLPPASRSKSGALAAKNALGSALGSALLPRAAAAAAAPSPAPPRRLLAICGPSGSGKTTLLGAISGQLPHSKALRLSGDVTINGRPIAERHEPIGFVAQEDIFYSQLTVRETLLMAAELRLPAGTKREEREELVDAIIGRLGLSKTAHTIVGDAKTRGLSGARRARLWGSITALPPAPAHNPAPVVSPAPRWRRPCAVLECRGGEETAEHLGFADREAACRGRRRADHRAGCLPGTAGAHSAAHRGVVW
jgi:hypothetical protein